MSKKRRLRKVAKNFKNQPRHKKLIAEFLADLDINARMSDERLKKMLVKGYRGYAAWDERQLCAYFDKTYDQLLDGTIVTQTNSTWTVQQEWIKRADDIYSEVFEKIFLN